MTQNDDTPGKHLRCVFCGKRDASVLEWWVTDKSPQVMINLAHHGHAYGCGSCVEKLPGYRATVSNDTPDPATPAAVMAADLLDDAEMLDVDDSALGCAIARGHVAKIIASAEQDAAAKALLELCKSSLNPDTLEGTATYCQSELPNTANWLREIAAHIRPAVRRLEAAMKGGTT